MNMIPAKLREPKANTSQSYVSAAESDMGNLFEKH